MSVKREKESSLHFIMLMREKERRERKRGRGLFLGVFKWFGRVKRNAKIELKKSERVKRERFY